jgi:hypothetical protein
MEGEGAYGAAVSQSRSYLLKLKITVIPAKAGIHIHQWWLLLWIPAFAGMTNKVLE